MHYLIPYKAKVRLYESVELGFCDTFFSLMY